MNKADILWSWVIVLFFKIHYSARGRMMHHPRGRAIMITQAVNVIE
eukprot:SAG22_NODE_30_length_28348_cov_12.488584_1_plen_46_part_00